MTPTITILMMLIVTLGAALYVAWPLLFGRVRAEEYLAFGDDEFMSPPADSRRAAHLIDDEDLDVATTSPRRKGLSSDSRVDLDVEQEIEAFRRKAHQSSGQVSSLTCPSCGRPVKDPDAAFCSKCGAPVRKVAEHSKKKAGKSREDR